MITQLFVFLFLSSFSLVQCNSLHTCERNTTLPGFKTKIIKTVAKTKKAKVCKQGVNQIFQRCLEGLQIVGIKAVIFDLDGTIYTSDCHWDEVTKNVVRRLLKRELTQDSLRALASFEGHSNNEVAQKIKEHWKLEIPAQKIADEMTAEAMQEAVRSSRLVDGFSSFIKFLITNGIVVAVGSNATFEVLELMSNHLGLKPYFGKHLYCYQHVGEQLAKPDPAVFLYAAQALGVQPSQCLVFEDSKIGFLAAEKARMLCIAIENKRNKDHRHLVVKTIRNFSCAYDALANLPQTAACFLRRSVAR